MKSHKFFPKVYTDEETERLSEEYDVKSCPDEYIPSTLCRVECEIGAQKLLSISKCFGKFVGVSWNTIEKMDLLEEGDFDYISYLDEKFDEKYIRTKKRGKLEIIFPTEELLINQRVRKK